MTDDLSSELDGWEPLDRSEWVKRCQDELRRALRLRPETRLDNIIFRDGSAYELQEDGILVRVR